MTTSTSREIASAAIRARLAQVALDEVKRRGFDQVTLDDLARAAGVSRTTFFRYLRSKEEAVMSGLSAHGERVAERLASRPAAEDDWSALRHAMDYICEIHRDDPAASLAFTKLIYGNPSFGRARSQQHVGWRTALAAALRQRSPGRSPGEAIALTSAALGCLSAATEALVAADGALVYEQQLDEAFGVLRAR